MRGILATIDLEGGDGDDVLNGGAGDDLLIGGSGVDKFVFFDELAFNSETFQDELVSSGDDRVLDFDESDRLEFEFEGNAVTEISQVGDDVLVSVRQRELDR